MHRPVLSAVVISSLTHHKCCGLVSSSFYRWGNSGSKVNKLRKVKERQSRRGKATGRM